MCVCVDSLLFAVTLAAASLVSFVSSRKMSSLFLSLSLSLSALLVLAFFLGNSHCVVSLVCVCVCVCVCVRVCQISERFLASYFLVIMSWDALSVLSSGPVSQTVQWSMLQMLSLVVVVVELDKLDDRLPCRRRRRRRCCCCCCCCCCCKTNVL